jgi:hypothetical protein
MGPACQGQKNASHRWVALPIIQTGLDSVSVNQPIDRYIKLIGFNEMRGALLLFIARIDQPLRDTYEQRCSATVHRQD